MANCYIFNPGDVPVNVTLNGVFLNTVPATDPAAGYAPRAVVTQIKRRRDDQGSLSLIERNVLEVAELGPSGPLKPRSANICLPLRNVSMDDDVVIQVTSDPASRSAAISVMTARGFALEARCRGRGR